MAVNGKDIKALRAQVSTLKTFQYDFFKNIYEKVSRKSVQREYNEICLKKGKVTSGFIKIFGKKIKVDHFKQNDQPYLVGTTGLEPATPCV